MIVLNVFSDSSGDNPTVSTRTFCLFLSAPSDYRNIWSAESCSATDGLQKKPKKIRVFTSSVRSSDLLSPFRLEILSVRTCRCECIAVDAIPPGDYGLFRALLLWRSHWLRMHRRAVEHECQLRLKRCAF